MEEEPSWYKLLLDLLTIQSIFFGLSVLNLLRMVSVKLQMGQNKPTLLLIYFLCSAGFACQTYHVFDVIINENLSQSQHYTTLETIQMPLIIFCFRCVY